VLFGEVRDAVAALNAFLAERIDGVEVIQLFSISRSPSASSTSTTRRFRRATSRSNVYDSLMFAVVDGAAAICVGGDGPVVRLGLAGSGGSPAGEAEPISVGLLVAFIEYLDRLFGRCRELSSPESSELQRGVPRREDPRAARRRRDAAGRRRAAGRGPRPSRACATSASDTGPRPRTCCAASTSRSSARGRGDRRATGSGKTTLTRLLDALIPRLPGQHHASTAMS